MKTIFQKKYIACLLICSAMCSLISLSTLAQDAITLRSNTEGFHIGIGGGYKHWTSSYFNRLDETEPMGLGGGINLGYGINQHIELFASYEYHTFKFKTEWDDYGLSTFGVGARYNFGGTLQAIRPFVEVAYNYQNLLINPVELNGQLFEYKMKGGALSLGGGVNFFVTPKLAINAKAGANLGKFSSFLVDNDGIEDRPDVKTFQFGIGLNYFFN
jgi:hypothetical protein